MNLNIYEALGRLEEIKQFCYSSVSLGTGRADKAAELCRSLRDVLVQEMKSRIEYDTVSPSEVEAGI